MKPAEYWRKRAEINARAEHAKADLYINQQAKEYRKSVNTIIRDIEAFYGRYADENQVSLLEAKKQLDKGELAEFKMTLEEFTAKAKDNADGRWTQQLNNVYYRTRISRYEALLTQIRHELEMLTGRQQTGFLGLLSGNYTESYYWTLFDIQKGTGLGTTFALVDDRQLEKALYTDWAGSNFSKRIWGNRDKLAREIQTNLSQAFIRGDSLDKVVLSLRDRFDVSKSNAARLVRTESAHIAAEATYDGYKSSGVVKQYQFLATLDLRTSETCRGMDDRIFSLSDKEVGVNWPPLHANCRSTTVAYFDDEDSGERIARDLDGTSYYVPENMKYSEWYQKHVIDRYGAEAAEVAQKKITNQSSDKAQFDRYKKILGSDAPKSLSAFQDLKYTDSEGWLRLNADYRKLNAYDKITANEPQITTDLQEISNRTGAELVGLEYRLKTKESYLRKVNSDSKNSLDAKVIGETISGTNDVIRYTYQASGDKLVESYFSVLSEMEAKGYSTFKLKNTWRDKRNPYRGINAIFTSSSGQRFEVQFHTPESFDLKNGQLHKLYEEFRLDSTPPERRGELTREMFALSASLEVPKDIDNIK
ncbi:minor capsid protein [Paenibacillus sp. FSL R5-0407]|uniref:minor capsid protein n=1 Tax=Paenibacillus sp. FSL R5-0407 TaxID=2975320 RepID=UPI0030F8C733